MKLYFDRKIEQKTSDEKSEVNGKIKDVNRRLKVVKKKTPKDVKVNLSDLKD
ncbi:MAG: hypothetical protein ACOC89_04480 [Candidatus Saliniplasma sp.]